MWNGVPLPDLTLQVGVKGGVDALLWRGILERFRLKQKSPEHKETGNLSPNVLSPSSGPKLIQHLWALDKNFN